MNHFHMHEIPAMGKTAVRWFCVLLLYLRTAVLYLALILAVRLMGKRQIGQMEASEFVVTMMAANLATIPLQDSAIPMVAGLVPILTVLGMELVLSWWILKSIRFRRLFCGKPVILIDNGEILYENLRKTRVSLDELMGHLRQKDVLDLNNVQYAILETNGNLSVFPYPEAVPPCAKDAGIPVSGQTLPITIVADGILFREDLLRSGRDMAWLWDYLDQEKLRLKDILLLSVDTSGVTLLLRKENP